MEVTFNSVNIRNYTDKAHWTCMRHIQNRAKFNTICYYILFTVGVVFIMQQLQARSNFALKLVETITVYG